MLNPKKIESKELQEILDDITDRISGMSDRGKVAQYIPELATADLNQFGITVAPLGGSLVSAGNADRLFSIQSISKVFSLTIALERVGATLWQRVGREPSGDPFNSIVQLEHERGIPRNPFINPGAIVVADILVRHRTSDEAIQEILELCRGLAEDSSIHVDEAVAESEMRTGSKNRALANFMKAEGNLEASVEEVLSLYFRQCSIEMSCHQLALAGRYLAAGGRNPADGSSVLSAQRARRVTALMMMCGSYDASGEFAFRVGLPAKSGVGGGILCIVPGVASVVAWSPGLDKKGNSHLATIAFQELVRATGWSVFESSA